MKLWQKETKINELVEKFTIGNDPEFDLKLAEHDIIGTLAHTEMLCSIGLLSDEEFALLKPALHRILQTVKNGTFEIEPGVEDIHSQVELLLTRELGETGKKIHAGRSRNDQVLVDLRLFFRSEIKEIMQLTNSLFDVLISQSEQYKNVLMPGYTHTQVAMVSSFGLWFSAYAETLVDDMSLLQTIHKINNQNPLGSAAGFGSSFPLDRTLTTRLLEFDDLNYNVVHAQMGRGKTEQFMAFAMAAIANTLGKLAADVVLYSSQNFAFLQLPDAFTTGSSIMPHKKNPDVFELIRGHCSVLQSLPSQVSALTTNLTSGYHRDFQLLKEIIFPALDKLKDCLKLTAYSLSALKINKEILEDEKYQYLYTVEVVNELVKNGIPFRDAYQQVGQMLTDGDFEFSGTPNHTHEGSLGNLCLEEIKNKMLKVLASAKNKQH